MFGVWFSPRRRSRGGAVGARVGVAVAGLLLLASAQRAQRSKYSALTVPESLRARATFAARLSMIGDHFGDLARAHAAIAQAMARERKLVLVKTVAVNAGVLLTLGRVAHAPPFFDFAGEGRDGHARRAKPGRGRGRVGDQICPAVAPWLAVFEARQPPHF